MPPAPDPADPGWDDDPARLDLDPVTAQQREAWLDHLASLDEPPDPEEYWDPDGPPPPGEDKLAPDELAGIQAAAADETLAVEAATAGRRGPGHPGPPWVGASVPG